MSNRPRRCLHAAIIVAFALPCAAAVAGPLEEFQKAKNAYTFGDYKLAMATLDHLLNPKVRLERTGDIHEALELLGIAAFYEGDRPRSREAFVRLLSLEPDHKLDPLLVRPEVVDFFSGIRSELREKLDELRRRRELQRQWEREQGLKDPGEVEVRRELVTPYVLNWVPFGVPQFTYGNSVWGSIFLAAQSAALLTSVSAYGLRESLRREDGTAAPGDGDQADTLASVQVGAGLTFIALAIWGVADAHLRWPGTTKPLEDPPSK